jgi:aryl-alcohol dehydrogenase-like predicted oxidoreductase
LRLFAPRCRAEQSQRSAAANMQLALGTVQFGLGYGIAGRPEPVPEQEVRAILEDAVARGVRTLDTAAAYGDIEERLAHLTNGLSLSVISKIPSIPDALSPSEAARFALASACRSRERLGEMMTGLMLHRSNDLLGARGDAVSDTLAQWVSDSGVALGVSCYGPSDFASLCSSRAMMIAIAQLPGNALDQRIAVQPACQALAGVDVYLRSVFLQGLLLMSPTLAKIRLPVATHALARWHGWCERQGLNPLTAALSVVKSFSAVGTVLVGVDSLAQWSAIADAWDKAKPTPAPALASDDARVIDPRNWSPEK